MSEGSNHNLTSEFRKHPDRAKWLLDRVLPAMKHQFEEFDIDVVIGTLTDDSMDAKKIKSLFSSYQKKQNSFQAKGVKRARPAYHFFCGDTRKQLQEDNDDLGFGDVNKKLGEMWNQLNSKDRKPYEKKAVTDKKRYETEFTTARQKAIDSGEYTPNPLEGIKKARTSYLCFSTDSSIRKKHSKQASDNKELMKILGSVWGEMDEQERKPYQDLADQDKERYEKEKKTALKKQEKLNASKAKLQPEQPSEPSQQSDNDEEEVAVVKKAKKSPSKKKVATKKTSSNTKKSSLKKTKKSVSSDEEEDDE